MSSRLEDEFAGERVLRLSDGQWDIRYRTTAADLKCSRELTSGFGSTLGLVFSQLGLPLAPSLAVLLAAEMFWASAVFAGTFVAFAIYCAAQPQRVAAEVGQTFALLVRLSHLDAEMEFAQNRRSWSLFDQASLKRSWLCLERNGIPIVAIPRRLFQDDELQRLLADLQSHIATATEAPVLTTLECGQMNMSSPFVFTTAELSQLVTGNIAGIEGETKSGSGLLTMLILLMMGAGAAISQLPVSSLRKMVMWCAVCASIWLPRLMWLLLEKNRVRSLLRVFQELEEHRRQHGIGPQGFTDVWEQAQEIWQWEHVRLVKDSQDFILIYGKSGSLYGVPKRVFRAPQETLEEARRYWREANPTETRETSAAEPATTFVPGPAIESGNPYQPPTSDDA